MREIVISIPCAPDQEDDTFVGREGQVRLIGILHECAEFVGESEWPEVKPGTTVVIRSPPDGRGVRRKVLDIRLY